MAEVLRLSWKFRVLNAALRPFSSRLARFRLSVDDLLAEAQRETGLSDYGDDGFRTGLERLVQSLEEEAALTPLGRIVARTDIGSNLQNRLRLQEWRKSHPEVAEQKIERPIVMMGMGRTGTTILHDILAQDPNNRVPLTWEVDHPCPAPEAATYATDPRIAATDRELAQTDVLIPDFKKMHPMGALLPQECVRILSLEFASMVSQIAYRVPAFSRWLHEEADLGYAYAAHRRFLQHLQSRKPGRWVLKSPGHLWQLDALLAEYPDAVLIQTHRDPLRVLASLTSLGATLRSMCSDEIDHREIGAEWSHWNCRAYDLAVDARASGRVRADQIMDVQFTEFMSDQLAVIRRVYEFAGLELRPEVEERMRNFIEANPADKHGKHAYRFADTGLDEGAEREKVRRYQEYFDVKEEAL